MGTFITALGCVGKARGMTAQCSPLLHRCCACTASQAKTPKLLKACTREKIAMLQVHSPQYEIWDTHVLGWQNRVPIHATTHTKWKMEKRCRRLIVNFLTNISGSLLIPLRRRRGRVNITSKNKQTNKKTQTHTHRHHQQKHHTPCHFISKDLSLKKCLKGHSECY